MRLKSWILCMDLITRINFLKTAFASKVDVKETFNKSAFIKGDFIIGALFPVHDIPVMKNYTNVLTCGQIRDQQGIQIVEAAFFAMDMIEKNKNILPGIRLGINIKDDCWSESIALGQTVNLIEDPSKRDNDISILHNKTCSETTPISPLIGIIGPASSKITISVQTILKLFHIPQLGYSATSTELDDTKKYPYFLKVVPNDVFQTKLILSLLKKFGWTYVSLVYTDNNYGQNGMNYFRRNSSFHDVCIANYAAVKSTADYSEFEQVIHKLNKDKKANVIVCYCEGSTVNGLLAAIKKANLTGRFTFLGSDIWATRFNQIKNYEAEAKGSMTLGIDDTKMFEFDEYFLSRNLTNNQRNPWFEEFWENRFNCSANPYSNSYSRICTGNENLKESYEQDSKVNYVIKSIYTMAYALHAMHDDICHHKFGLCDELTNFNTSLYMEYLLKTNFKYGNEFVRFTSNHEPWKVKYNIFNFQRRSNGTFEYVQIGDFQKHNQNEFLDIYDEMNIQYSSDHVTKSICSEPCLPGNVQVNDEGFGKKCCWTCIECKSAEIIFNGSACLACYEGFWPNGEKTLCLETSLKYVLIIYSLVSIVLTLITAFIFIKYQDTPVVKSSTKELCYMMLIGMIIAHCTAFVALTEQNVYSCAILRSLPSLSFTIIHASLLVKTNRIARILAISKKKFPNMKPRFITLSAQIIITFTLIGIQIIICVAMLIEESPALMDDYHKELGYVLCPLKASEILPPFSFVGILVILCTLYAVKTRNVPHNFNEAKFIGLAMYVTCLLWIAFALVYFESRLKIIIMCICASTNALVILSCIFFPKLYIIIWKPEENTRANFITSKGIRCIIAGGSSSNSLNNKKIKRKLLEKNKTVSIDLSNVPRHDSRV